MLVIYKQSHYSVYSGYAWTALPLRVAQLRERRPRRSPRATHIRLEQNHCWSQMCPYKLDISERAALRQSTFDRGYSYVISKKVKSSPVDLLTCGPGSLLLQHWLEGRGHHGRIHGRGHAGGKGSQRVLCAFAWDIDALEVPLTFNTSKRSLDKYK